MYPTTKEDTPSKMYDLLDIIETRLNGMDHLIRKWMTNQNFIKSSLINDIKTIKDSINIYHNIWNM